MHLRCTSARVDGVVDIACKQISASGYDSASIFILFGFADIMSCRMYRRYKSDFESTEEITDRFEIVWKMMITVSI